MEGVGKTEFHNVWKKINSGQTGQSESQVEKSVFPSDKEETDQQNPKRLARDGPQLESKVAGTPTALTSPVKRTSSSSSSSNTSSLTHIKPSNQEQRNKATDTVPNAVVRGKDQDKSSKSVRHASSPKFLSGKKTVTPVVSKYNDQRSKLDRASGAGETTSVSEMTVTMNPTSAAVPSTSIPQSTVTDTPVSTSSEPQEMVSGSADKKLKLRSGDTVGGIRLEGFRKSDERPVLCTDVSESTSQSYDVSSGQLQLGLSEDHPDHRQQAQVQAIETVVATDTKSKDDPQLLKIKKLDSPRAEEASTVVDESVEATKPKKKVGFTTSTKDPKDSGSHSATGGMMQKTPTEQDSPPVMRQRTRTKRHDRRVSCKDLGQGDCEGWLYKRKEKGHTLSRHWIKHWCVLKNFNLYYYKSKEALKAEGVIYMPAFQVSPAPNLKTKKFAFKIHNPGTSFHFASERQDDMSKWMNKMGLAAISFDASQRAATETHASNADYSESDEEDGTRQWDGSLLSITSNSSAGSSSTTPHSSPPVSRQDGSSTGILNEKLENIPATQTLTPGQLTPDSTKGDVDPTGSDDMHCVLRAIHIQDLTIDGVDRQKRRTRHINSILGGCDGKSDVRSDKLRHLMALKRTLKVKEQTVQDIDRLLASHLSSSRLMDFVSHHPEFKV